MLDITAFSNALLDGNVSFLSSMNVWPFQYDDDSVVHLTGEDAVVYPIGTGGDTPRYALRLPLEPGSDRTWPSHYADLASVEGSIAAFLPTGITILDVDDLRGTDVALLYDWIPGESLTKRVIRSRNRHDRDTLAELMWPLADLGEALRVSGMVHGDIAPGNIIVRRDGGMSLVDLDRVGFRGDKEPPAPRRRPGYRLPRSGGAPVEEDAFALLVLMVTCGILADSNVPIEHEETTEASHPMLLFSSWDLMDPQRSRMVREIEQQLSSLSGSLLELLKAASTGPTERVPGLLRDAIQRIRRSGPNPAAGDVAGDAPHVLWHPAGDGRDEHSAGESSWQLPEPEPAEDNDEQPPDSHVDRSWPAPPPARQRSRRPSPARAGRPSAKLSTASPAPRQEVAPEPGWDVSVERIVADIKAVASNETAQSGENRRAARARRRQEEIAKELKQALETNDRRVLVRLAMSGALAELGDSERGDLVQVVRALAHDSISRAIARDDDGMIVAAVDESVFQSDSDLDPAFRERVQLARQREAWTDQMLEAVRKGDPKRTADIADSAPDGAFERLPESTRHQAQRLVEQQRAEAEAKRAIQSGDADGLARALSRLATIRPVWTDHIDPSAVVTLLGEEQIEERLIARLADRALEPEDQWMVDVVIAVGRLPEATRLSGLTTHEVDRLIFKDM